MKANRGRPAKKPGYDREAEIQSFIDRAVELAVEPFDDFEERDPDLPTMTEIANAMETTLLRVRKLLITADYFTSTTARQIQNMNDRGMSIADIMEITGLGKASVYSYLPYSKGVYNLADPTLYSEQGKRYRMRKAAVRELEEHKDLPDVSLYLWKAVIAFQDYPFATSGRGKDKTGSTKFKYTVSSTAGSSGHRYSGIDVPGYSNELWIIIDGVKKEKSISRSTVELAYKNALRLMDTEGAVKGPKALGIPGAGSYLYPILLRLGVTRNTPVVETPDVDEQQ